MSKQYRVLGGFAWWLIGLTAFDLLMVAVDILSGHTISAVFMTVCALTVGFILRSEVRWRASRKALAMEGERDARTGND